MKKFLILLSLIFFVSCENKECVEKEFDPLNPPKESECLSRNSMIVENVELPCCYIKMQMTNQKLSITSAICYPFKKDYSKEDLQKLINDIVPSDEDLGVKVEIKKVSCKGSYLKFGFLLLTLLLI